MISIASPRCGHCKVNVLLLLKRFVPVMFKVVIKWYHILSGVWVFVSPLAVFLLNDTKDAGSAILGLQDYFGLGLWLVGISIEAISDQQKKEFSSNPTNKDKLIKTGLWSISRHPNCMYCGVWITVS